MAASTSATKSSAPPSDSRGGYDIFLSHSGSQKLFTHILYITLTLAGYSCFFDQDSDKSLRKGDNVKDKIVNAIQDCRLAVVVISEEFITSYWPLFELQYIIQRKGSDHSLIIYPIFYKLSTSDLTDHNNLVKWKEKIDASQAPKNMEQNDEKKKELDASQAPTNMKPNDEKHSEFDKLKICMADALKAVKGFSGSILMAQSMNEYEFIVHTVFPDVCKICPPPTRYYRDNDYIKGQELWIKDIHDHFDSIAKKMLNVNMDNCMMTLGVHGIGGCGKSTLCKIMFDWYTQVKTPSMGMCLLLPTDKDEKEFVEQLKDALDKFGICKYTRISQIDQALSTFIQQIKASGKNIFLAIDNVWPWSEIHVRRIVQSLHKVGMGGKLIVTSRSAELLEKMFENNIKRECYDVVPIPSITKEAAVDALLSYSSINKDNIYCNKTLLKKVNEVVKCCFFHGRCYPLVLKAIGSRLIQVQDTKEQVLDECIQQLRAQKYLQNEDDLVHVLRTSFSLLTKDLQGIFLDITLINLARSTYSGIYCHGSINEVLYIARTLHNCSMEKLLSQCERLQYYGLWKVTKIKDHYGGGARYDFKVHDLYVDLAKTEGKYNCPHEPKTIKYEVDGYSRMAICDSLKLRQFSDLQRHGTNFQYLSLHRCRYLVDLRGIDSCQALQHLSLISCSELEEISCIQSCTALQHLNLESFCSYDMAPSDNKIKFPTVNLPNLKSLTVPTIKKFMLGEGESSICVDEQMPRLEELCLSCEEYPLSLEKVLCQQKLSSLRILKIHFCLVSISFNGFRDSCPLKRVPSLLSSVVQHLTNLKTLSACIQYYCICDDCWTANPWNNDNYHLFEAAELLEEELGEEVTRDSFSDWTISVNWGDRYRLRWDMLFQR